MTTRTADAQERELHAARRMIRQVIDRIGTSAAAPMRKRYCDAEQRAGAGY